VWEQTELPWYSRGKMLFCPGNTAPVISLLGASPIIVTVHSLAYKYFPEAYHPAFRLYYRLVVPILLRHARLIITVSEAERRAILMHYPRAAPRLHAIANGGLPSGVSETARPAEQLGGAILYVGSLAAHKNFPRAFTVACRLARERGFDFVFVGGTPKGLVGSGINLSNEVSSRIRFVGAVNNFAALIPYYQTAACFLFPSLYESSGLPPLEAMAFGCPVIVSDIPALRERCGDAAIYCDPHDADSIAQAITRVMEDKELRCRLREMGYQRAASYTWKACAFETLDLIEKLGQVSCKSSAQSR
jgi:glycosyltransferase involved in cell wall biosynthesis